MLLFETGKAPVWNLFEVASASIVAAEEERFSIFNYDLIIQLMRLAEAHALLCNALWVEGFRHQISENQISNCQYFLPEAIWACGFIWYEGFQALVIDVTYLPADVVAEIRCIEIQSISMLSSSEW